MTAHRQFSRRHRLKQDEGLERALAREADSQAHSYASKDIQEGILAVQQKRTPKF